jgi:hypothetical protein
MDGMSWGIQNIVPFGSRRALALREVSPFAPAVCFRSAGEPRDAKVVTVIGAVLPIIHFQKQHPR